MQTNPHNTKAKTMNKLTFTSPNQATFTFIKGWKEQTRRFEHEGTTIYEVVDGERKVLLTLGQALGGGFTYEGGFKNSLVRHLNQVIVADGLGPSLRRNCIQGFND